jgi:methylated-DNA-protein-cysteine methyltransferase related protein
VNVGAQHVRQLGRAGLDGGGQVDDRDAREPTLPFVRLEGERAQRVLARVRAIPPGFVRTYGDVSPGAPRFAGTVLFACDDPDVPWHRVVRADGTLAKGARQRRRLLREGVPFRGGRVVMRVARLPD